MNAQLTIVNKGLLLVAVPLAVQAIFIGMLLHTHAELNNAQRWAVHTKEVIARVEELYRRLLEGYTGNRILAVSNRPLIGRTFREAFDKIPAEVEELKVLTSDNNSQTPRFAVMTRQIEAFREWLATQQRLMDSGQRGQALDGLDEGATLLGSVRATTDAILAEEEQLDNDRMASLHSMGNVQGWTLIVGGLAFVGTTLALALVFLNGVIKRLAVLRDNARRFGEGKGLAPPLNGNDEIAQVDRAFHDMATSLDQQKQENEMFVYSVSHDLRSPLINLQGFSEELSLSYRELHGLFHHEEIPPAVRAQGHKLLTENIEDSIRYIQTAVGRLARIIDALLRLSRAGRVEYHLQTLDLQSITSKIVDALHDTIVAKKADVVVGELPPVCGDATAVEQVFANLISNAVNYLDGARSGTIEVGCTDHDSAGTTAGFRVYFIKDNGLGIPEAYHQRVFTAFSRLHADVAQGEGIGLALVRRIVERHGGKIWLQSAAGAGSTFFIALPAAAPDEAPSGELERQTTNQGSKGENQTWQPSRT